MVNFYLLAFIILFLDQITKYLFTNIHSGLINYTTNTGAGFSILQGYNTLLIIITILILLIILYYKKKEPNYRIPLVFIFSGALGNLIDRIFLGYIRDFIDLKFWPVFNLTDTFIVIGTILLIYYHLSNRSS